MSDRSIPMEEQIRSTRAHCKGWPSICTLRSGVNTDIPVFPQLSIDSGQSWMEFKSMRRAADYLTEFGQPVSVTKLWRHLNPSEYDNMVSTIMHRLNLASATTKSPPNEFEFFCPGINETNLTVRPMCTFIHDGRHDARVHPSPLFVSLRLWIGESIIGSKPLL